MSKKVIKLTPQIAERIKKSGGQPRHGECVVCKGDWDTCSHTRKQIYLLERAVELREVLA